MDKHQVLFAVSPRPDGGLDILLGVPADGWEYMKDGQTHNFDLTLLNLDIRIIMYGGPDQAAVMQWIEQHNAALGVTEVADMRGRDFNIHPKKPPPGMH